MTSSLLPPNWGVPQTFRDRLGTKVGRQRAMETDGHVLLVLHRPPAAGDAERIGRYLWRTPDGTWTSSDLGTGVQAMRKHLDEYEDATEAYDRDEETATSVEDYFRLLTAVAPLDRAARNLYRVLEHARKLCPTDRDLIDARDRAYEIERTLELLFGEAQHSLDFMVARREEEQTRASHRMATAAHRLNMLAAFFLPLATLSAVFGMNLLHGLEETRPPLPFVLLVVGGLGVGSVLALFIAREPDARNNRSRRTKATRRRPQRY